MLILHGRQAFQSSWEVFRAKIRGGTHTIYTATCADEGGTQGALLMCYSYVVYLSGNQTLQPITECEMGKGM